MCDLEQKAIERLKVASDMSLRLYKQPLVITYSGGKDSDVLLHLAQASGIQFEVLHSLTTADAPETVYHVRDTLKSLLTGICSRRIQRMTTEEAIETIKTAIAEVEWNYPMDYAVAFEMAIEALKANQWVSVESRLPENEKDVLICVKRQNCFAPEKYICLIVKAFYTDGKHDTDHTAYTWQTDYLDMEYDEEHDTFLIPEGWWESIEYGEEFTAVSDFVTHWMPLPKPPKQEKD
jgi:hypothetical protein